MGGRYHAGFDLTMIVAVIVIEGRERRAARRDDGRYVREVNHSLVDTDYEGIMTYRAERERWL